MRNGSQETYSAGSEQSHLVLRFDTPFRSFQRCVWLLLLLCASSPMRSAGLANGQNSSALHDGQHDFDFNLGTWHTHIRSILDPFSGSSEAMELNGTVKVSKV